MTIQCDHHGALILPAAADSSTPRCSRCGEAIAGRKARGSGGLMAARGENSVLFSLDSLRALTGDERPTPASRAPAAASGPQDGSGLIDIRALDAMMRSPGRPTTPPRLPRFGDLTAAPVALAPSPAVVRAPATSAPAPMAFYVLLGLIALGMMALAMHVATRGPVRPIVIERHVMSAPAVAAAEAPAESEPEAEKEAEAPAPEVASAEPPPPAEPVKAPRKPAKKPPPEPAAEKPVKAAAPPVATGPAPDSVECLLGGAACKQKPAAPAPAVAPSPAPSDSLPEKLEPADISEGTRAAKAAAIERCRVHARGGEKVTIKLSIAGPDGSVLSTTPQDDAGNPTLARCCAAELMRSSFKKVRKAQIGAVATLKF